MNNLILFFCAAILTALILIIWGAARIYRRWDACFRLIASASVTGEYLLLKDGEISEAERESILVLHRNQFGALVKLKDSRP